VNRNKTRRIRLSQRCALSLAGANRRKAAVLGMTKSVWIYVNPRRDYVKVFDSSDSALEWFQDHDPSGVAVQLPLEESQTPMAKPTHTDHQILIEAFLKARAIIRDYVEDGKASLAVEQLTRILFNDQVVAAISRVDRRRRFGVIEGIRVRDDAG
jgi:hypothetical protein